MNFWDRVNKTASCWNWIGALKDKRYGVYSYNDKKERTHRVSWMLHYGDIPEGLCVLHKCDNMLCINPDHLFLGTKGDNARDRNNKGRTPKGSAHPRAKLTEQDVLSIRESKEGRRNLAKKFGVSADHITNIIGRRKWTHV